jgi:RHS repeat-associated protein
MQWDYRDQLQTTAKQVNDHGTPEKTWYVYDAGGQRVRKVTERQAVAGQTPNRTKERIYLGGFEIHREYENDGSAVKLERETLHITDDKQRIALVETKTFDLTSPLTPHLSLIRYQFSNHLGSASLELDNQAQIISYEEYYPYGSTSYQAGRSVAEVSLKRYRYTGMERDEENGFAYHGARYYAPWLGRWGNCDPIGIQDGSNLFGYSKQNPVNHTDRTGQETDAEWSSAKHKEVEAFHRFVDVDRNKHITGKELREGFRCSTISYSTWWAIAGGDTPDDYTFDPTVQKLLERPSLSLERQYELSETTLRYNSEGGTYTKREGRAATKRWLKRHRDPERLITMAKVGAAVLAPEYYFTASSIYHSATGNPKEAALDLAGVLAGRWLQASSKAPHVGASPSKTRVTPRGSNVGDAGRNTCVGNICAIMKNTELRAGQITRGERAGANLVLAFFSAKRRTLPYMPPPLKCKLDLTAQNDVICNQAIMGIISIYLRSPYFCDKFISPMSSAPNCQFGRPHM